MFASLTIPTILVHPVCKTAPASETSFGRRLPSGLRSASASSTCYKRSSLSFCTSSSDESDDDHSEDDDERDAGHRGIQVVVTPTSPSTTYPPVDARERRQGLAGRSGKVAGDARRELGLKAAVGSYRLRQSHSCQFFSFPFIT
jgi:hypothetical protein